MKRICLLNFILRGVQAFGRNCKLFFTGKTDDVDMVRYICRSSRTESTASQPSRAESLNTAAFCLILWLKISFIKKIKKKHTQSLRLKV